MRCFQNCLDYFHIENLQELISRSLTLERTRKRSKIDPDRAAYSNLLDHMVSQLQRFRRQAANNKKVVSPSLLDLQLISPISNQLIQLTKRQCNERATLFQIIFTFYKQALIIMDISCQETIKKSLLEYFQNLEANRKQSEIQINTLKNQLHQLKQDNDEKWKTFYMIVKDNRVLRRQKGKLMRTLEYQKQKLCNVHEQMMEIAKENQKSKLLANYDNNPESLSLFLKNTQAIFKLDQYMKNYPKQRKKLLKIDLKKLQISQNSSLDEKIKYIIKTAKYSQQIYEEYEDLIDTNQRPNKFILNISTQTDPFDIGLDPSHLKVEELKHLKKIDRNVQCQTLKHLKIQNSVLNLRQIVTAKPYSKIPSRRKALKTNAVEDLKLIHAVKHFKENMICRKVCNVKLKCKNPNLKAHKIHSNIYNLMVYHSEESYDFPILSTNHRLHFDMIRSKGLIRRQQDRRSSRNSKNISNRSSLDIQISLNKDENVKFDASKLKVKQCFNQLFKETTPNSLQQVKNQQLYNQVMPRPIIQSKSKLSNGKRSKKKYIINPPQTFRSDKKLTTLAKSFENRKIFTANGSTNQSTMNINATISSENPSKVKETKKSNQIINKSSTKLKNNQNQAFDKNHLVLPSQKVTKISKFEILTDPNRKQIRKSGFAAYKKINTVPDDLVIQELQSLQSLKKTSQEQGYNIELQISKQQNQISQQNQEVNAKNIQSILKKTSSRVKSINIFGSQNSKLITRIYKYIFNKRKDIAESSETFQIFLNSYIRTHYGLNQKIVINNHYNKAKIQQYQPLLTIFDLLLDKSLPVDYIQHLFKTFAKLLIISGFEQLRLPYEKGIKILQQLLKIHFGEQKLKQIKQNNAVFYQSPIVNVCQFFLSLDYQLRKQLQTSQICNFLQKILPSSQKSLNYDQLKQIFSLFIFEEHYHTHLITLKKYCNPQISIQNLCFYAIREEWKPLYCIQDFIIENYQKRCIVKQGYNVQGHDKFRQKFPWTYELVRQKQQNWNNQIRILKKYQSILQMNYLLNKHTPLSNYLSDIQDQFTIIKIKKQLKRAYF